MKKMLYTVKIQVYLLHCEDMTVVMATSVSANVKEHHCIARALFHRCFYNKQNITRPLVDTNLIFSC